MQLAGHTKVLGGGNRQNREKPIPKISENGKVRVIVEKNIRNWQICEIVETKMAKSVL